MKKLLNKIINSTTILIIIFSIGFYIINTGLITLDDEIYKEAFNSISTFIKWLQEFYTLWGGRITLTILINVFMNLPMKIFKIANVSIFIITILASYKIISMLIDEWNKKMKNTLLIVLFCSIFFISIPVINSGAIWLSGAMNYLWPVAAMLVAMIPFISTLKEIKIGNKYYIFAFIANIFAAFSEQTAAILIAFGLITIIWCKIEKIKINKILIAHYIIIVLLSSINLLAPGNSTRSYAEEIKWYPSFSSLSVMDKLVQGYIQLIKHLISDTTVLFSMIAILSSYFVITNKEIKKVNKCVAILPIIYVLLRLIFQLINQKIFEMEKFNIDVLYSRKILLQFISSAFIVGLIGLQLIYAFKTKKSGIIIAILYCASLCSALALSFSPTIYASGNRIFMATDILLVLINASLWIQLLQKLRKNHKVIEKILLIIIIMLALLFYIKLYKNGINNIIY